MNYYQARQRDGDKRWDYTCKNDGRVWPVGYCHAYRPLTAESLPMMPPESVAKAEAEQAPFRDKYHDTGHETAEEAERCYYGYKLDSLREFSVSDQLLPCAVCRAWTDKGMRPQGDYDGPMLCDEHRTREGYQQARPFRAGMLTMSS